MKEKKVKYTLSTGVVIGAVLGLVTGMLLGETASNFSFVGSLFLNLINMPLIALLMCAVMEAVGSLKPKELGKLGAQTISLFALSTAMAGVIGVVLGQVFAPGTGLDMSMFEVDTSYVAPDNGGVIDSLLNYFTNNIFSAMSTGNTLQCVFASILLGVALSVYGMNNETNPVLDGVIAIGKVVSQYIAIVINLLPMAIFSFVSQAVGVMGGQLFKALLLLVLANLCGMLIMTFFYGSIAATVCKVSLFKIFPKLSETATLAAVSASSAVTLPTKLRDCQAKLGVSPRIAKFVCPMGMSMNADGAVLFFTLSCLTVAQAFGIAYDMTLIVNMIVFSTAFSFAAITVPGGGLVMLAIVLQAMGLPASGMVIISAADFILGPIRTINNNIDDSMIAMIVAKANNEFSPEIFNGTKEFDPDCRSYGEIQEPLPQPSKVG